MSKKTGALSVNLRKANLKSDYLMRNLKNTRQKKRKKVSEVRAEKKVKLKK